MNETSTASSPVAPAVAAPRTGSDNPNAKLTAEAVRAIRERAGRPQPYGWQSELARELGVSPAAITMIVRGARWTAEELDAANRELQIAADATNRELQVAANDANTAEHFASGDRLIAVGGDRRVDVENHDGKLWAVPVLKNNGMDPQPLQQWLDSIASGARRI